MSLNWSILVFATFCISAHMHAVQSQLNNLRNNKWGFGRCPQVIPMKDFDITKLYGQQWYLIAHYSEGPLLDRHCASTTLSDANPGSDICRLAFDRASIEYDDGELKVAEFFILHPNETDHATRIDTYRNVPVTSIVAATDYDKYLLIHECNEFPRDNPLIYEQHAYINSRQAVWKGGLSDFQKALDIFESMGIDTGLFVLHNQDDCKSPPEVPEPLK